MALSHLSAVVGSTVASMTIAMENKQIKIIERKKTKKVETEHSHNTDGIDK